MILPLLLLAALPQDGPPPDPPEAPEPVEAPAADEPLGAGAEGENPLVPLRERLTDALLQRYPWLARERGRDLPDLGFGRHGTEGKGWWTTRLEREGGDLAAVQDGSLPALDRAELEWLASWVRAEAIVAFSVATERWDPVVYVQRAERVVRALVETAVDDRLRRAEEVVQVLVELPKLWENARRGLVSPSREWSDEARERLVDFEQYLREDLTSAFDDLDWSEGARDAFQRRCEEALRDTIAFRQWLADTPSSSSALIAGLEAENWQNAVHALTGSELTVAELKTRVLREVAFLDRELGRHREPRAPEGDELLVTSMTDRILETSQAAAGFAAAADLIDASLTDELELRVRERRAFGIPRAPWELLTTSPAVHYLYVERRGLDWRPEVTRTRSALLSVPTQRALGLRYGKIGEALLRSRSSGADDSPGSLVWNRANFEGWGLYVADWITRVDWLDNPFAADDALRAALARARILEAVRLVAALELHAEERPTLEVIEAFRRRTGFDLETARHEVQHAMHDPFHGIGFLGYLELLHLEERLARDSDPRTALARVIELVTSRPNARPADLKRLVIGG